MEENLYNGNILKSTTSRANKYSKIKTSILWTLEKKKKRNKEGEKLSLKKI